MEAGLMDGRYAHTRSHVLQAVTGPSCNKCDLIVEKDICAVTFVKWFVILFRCADGERDIGKYYSFKGICHDGNLIFLCLLSTRSKWGPDVRHLIHWLRPTRPLSFTQLTIHP